MSRRLRPVAWLLPILALGCDDAGPVASTGPGIAQVRFQAVAPPGLGRFAPGLVVEQVKASLIRIVADLPDTVGTRTAPFGVEQNTLSLNFSLFVAAPETLYVELEYQTAAGVTLFFASQQVVAVPGVPSLPPLLQPFYIGPGSNLAFVNLTPQDTVLSAGDSLQYDANALDGQQQPVPTFYAAWSTSDPRVTINALGLVRAPDITKLVTVTAQTPNGVFATTTLVIQGTAGLGLAPDSVEKLPGGTQQFAVALGGLRTSVFVWSVNGVDGGNATFGTVDSLGFYTAPAQVPSPSSFDLCARDTTRTGIQGCARVVISTVPSAGADVVVFNDINFLADYDTVPGNRRLIRNLVNFSNNLPRGRGTQVLHEYSHASLCLSTAECDQTDLAEMNNVIAGQGLGVVVYDTISRLPSAIPPEIKALFIWTPQRAYDTLEINTLKAFAAEGGRIIFLGEREPYYGQLNIDLVENRFFLEMGAQLTNVAADVAFGAPYVVHRAGIRSHQTTTGVDSLWFSAASIVVPGPNDFALVVDVLGQQAVLGGVAKIDLTPLPVPPAAARRTAPTAAAWRPTTKAGTN